MQLVSIAFLSSKKKKREKLATEINKQRGGKKQKLIMKIVGNKIYKKKLTEHFIRTEI